MCSTSPTWERSRWACSPTTRRRAYDTLVESSARAAFPRPRSRACSSRSRSTPGSSCSSVCRAASGGYAPVLTVGIGGTAVEIYRDIANALAPVTPDQALELLRTLRGWPLLDGFRGGARVDVEAAARAISAISRLGDHFGDTLVDLEVNPLIVHTPRCARGRLRVPASERSAVSGHDIVVDAGDIKLSGLLAEPAGTPPIAVVARDPGQRDVGPVLRRPGRRRRVTARARGGAGFHGLGDRPARLRRERRRARRTDRHRRPGGHRAPARSTRSRASTTSAPASSWSATRTGSSSRS